MSVSLDNDVGWCAGGRWIKKLPRSRHLLKLLVTAVNAGISFRPCQFACWWDQCVCVVSSFYFAVSKFLLCSSKSSFLFVVPLLGLLQQSLSHGQCWAGHSPQSPKPYVSPQPRGHPGMGEKLLWSWSASPHLPTAQSAHEYMAAATYSCYISQVPH